MLQITQLRLQLRAQICQELQSQVIHKFQSATKKVIKANFRQLLLEFTSKTLGYYITHVAGYNPIGVFLLSLLLPMEQDFERAKLMSRVVGLGSLLNIRMQIQNWVLLTF